jgi:Tol biopolymer transport system component
MVKERSRWPLPCLIVTLLGVGSSWGPSSFPATPSGLMASGEAPAILEDDAPIAFGSQRDGNDEIYVINPDGTGLTNLTNDPAFDIRPAWSPDRTQIAFSRDLTLWIMNADGSDQHQIYGGWASTATFSPDGQRVAFTTLIDGQTDIAVIDIDGTGYANLTNTPESNESFSAWRPTGGLIAFTSNRDHPGTPSGPIPRDSLYVMNEDGSGVTRLTNWPGNAGNPSWSPDGTRLVFDSGLAPGGQPGIFVINVDGTGLFRLPTRPGKGLGVSFEASWSPSGTRVVFQAIADPTNPFSSELWTMQLDGTDLTRVTMHPAYDGNAAWNR